MADVKYIGSLKNLLSYKNPADRYKRLTPVHTVSKGTYRSPAATEKKKEKKLAKNLPTVDTFGHFYALTMYDATSSGRRLCIAVFY